MAATQIQKIVRGCVRVSVGLCVFAVRVCGGGWGLYTGCPVWVCSHCTRRRLLYGRSEWQLRLITRIGKGYAARRYVRNRRARIAAARVLQRMYRNRTERHAARVGVAFMLFSIRMAPVMQRIGRGWLARRRGAARREHARMRAECAGPGAPCVRGARERVTDALCIDL